MLGFSTTWSSRLASSKSVLMMLAPCACGGSCHGVVAEFSQGCRVPFRSFRRMAICRAIFSLEASPGAWEGPQITRAGAPDKGEKVVVLLEPGEIQETALSIGKRGPW